MACVRVYIIFGIRSNLFGSFFAAYFYLGLIQQWKWADISINAITLISPFGISLLNTLLLLTSGYFLTTGMLLMSSKKFEKRFHFQYTLFHEILMTNCIGSLRYKMLIIYLNA
jgi:heme/copper-type cytochrome/quinol oxidase subunit 3